MVTYFQERVVAIIAAGRRELKRGLAGILASGRLNQAIHRVVRVAVAGIYPAIVMKYGSRRAIGDLRNVADRVINIPKILDRVRFGEDPRHQEFGLSPPHSLEMNQAECLLVVLVSSGGPVRVVEAEALPL